MAGLVPTIYAGIVLIVTVYGIHGGRLGVHRYEPA